MNVLEAIRGRRSIRKYQDRQIPREDLEKILEAGSFAPTRAVTSGPFWWAFTTGS